MKGQTNERKTSTLVIIIKAAIYCRLLMVMLWMSENEPVLLEALVDMVEMMEEPDEED